MDNSQVRWGAPKVLAGPRGNVLSQLHDNTTNRLSADFNVEKDNREIVSTHGLGLVLDRRAMCPAVEW